MAAPGPPAHRAWSSGLFACTDQCDICCLGCWCPCILYGRVADHMEGGGESTPALLYFLAMVLGVECIFPCCLSPAMRKNFRAKYGLADNSGGDWLSHCCCHECALCQEMREIDHLNKTGLARPAGLAPGVQYTIASPPQAQTMGSGHPASAPPAGEN